MSQIVSNYKFLSEMLSSFLKNGVILTFAANCSQQIVRVQSREGTKRIKCSTTESISSFLSKVLRMSVITCYLVISWLVK